jgi:hypothetical protein
MGRLLKDSFAVIDGFYLGGSIPPVHNSSDVFERGIKKGASAILVPCPAARSSVCPPTWLPRLRYYFILTPPIACAKC